MSPGVVVCGTDPGKSQPTNRCSTDPGSGKWQTDLNLISTDLDSVSKIVIGCPACVSEPLLTYTIYTYYIHMYLSVSCFATFTNKSQTTFKKLIEEESSQVNVSLSRHGVYNTLMIFRWSVHFPLTPCTGQFPRLSFVLRGGDEESVSVIWGSTVRYRVWWCRCPGDSVTRDVSLITLPLLLPSHLRETLPTSKCFERVLPFFFLRRVESTNRPTVWLGTTNSHRRTDVQT